MKMIVSGRVFDCFVIVLTLVLVLFTWYLATTGWHTHVRRLPALDAIAEAVGRAAEMARPIRVTSGTGGPQYVQTVAGLNVLDYTARLCARQGVEMIVTSLSYTVIPIQQELIRQAYVAEGNPEGYNPGIVRFLSNRTLAYAAGAAGIVVRENVAANIDVGSLGMEALIIWEAGKRVGSINIGGTHSSTRQMDVAVGTDYMLIGEDIFAAGAYLSEDPHQINTLAGGDILKGLSIVVLVVGSILALMGMDSVVKLLNL